MDFGPYAIEEEVGRGGMGVVYRAREHSLDRLVALKLIGEEISGIAVLRARFERESRLAASIDHPHIVTVHAVGEHDGRAYIAMQWVDGGDLRQRLAAGPMAPHEVVRLGAQIADALHAAHDRGLLHRDVKPANVLLRRGPRIHALLADFGIARDQKAEVQLTSTGGYVGTPLYTAPEQIAGLGAEPRSDVYALGCVLHTALTGAPPFAAGGDEAQLRWAHLNAPRPRASETAAGIPPALDDLVRRTIAVDPDDRPRSAGALAAQLEEIARELERPASVPILDPPTVAVSREPRPARAATPLPPEAPTQVAAPRRRVAPLAALGVLAALIAAAVVLLLTSGGDGDDPVRTSAVADTTRSTTSSAATTKTAGNTTTTTGTSVPDLGTSTPEIEANAGGRTPDRLTSVAVRDVLDRYLDAYAARSAAQMRPLLDPDVTRTGVRADGTCGTSSGRGDVLADYAKNFSLLKGSYAIRGIDVDGALKQEQDGSVATKGLKYAIGGTNGKPIAFDLSDESGAWRIRSVAASC